MKIAMFDRMLIPCLVFYKFLLDPAKSELCITVIILEPVPTHHIQDVENTIALTVDTVQYRVFVLPASGLISVTSWQAAGETFHLFATLTKHFC